jgi:hypothetical protein
VTNMVLPLPLFLSPLRPPHCPTPLCTYTSIVFRFSLISCAQMISI